MKTTSYHQETTFLHLKKTTTKNPHISPFLKGSKKTDAPVYILK
jgi:hypothetical protein